MHNPPVSLTAATLLCTRRAPTARFPTPPLCKGGTEGGLSRGISLISCLRKEAYRAAAPRQYLVFAFCKHIARRQPPNLPCKARYTFGTIYLRHDIPSARYTFGTIYLRHDMPCGTICLAARDAPAARKNTVGADRIRPPQQRTERNPFPPAQPDVSSGNRKKSSRAGRRTDTVGADRIRPPYCRGGRPRPPAITLHERSPSSRHSRTCRRATAKKSSRAGRI